jgi:curved DNA-binding protein CbpA
MIGTKSIVWFYVISVTVACCFFVAADEPNDNTSTKNSQESTEYPENNWGTYFDPSNVFCGKYDCYKILGFDYETWGKSPPDKKDITQSYRAMSKRWHPDKTKDAGAEERFMFINKAYKVLTSSKLRKQYDYMRERPDEYFMKYGAPTIYNYAPKADTVIVILILLAIFSVVSWYIQKARWQQVADAVVRDAIDGDCSSEQGIELRKKAEAMLANGESTSVTTADLINSATKKNKVKKTKKELRESENEKLRPIVQRLVNEISDFGAGFHKPTWKDILVVKLIITWPIAAAKGSIWYTKYFTRRALRKPLNDEEKLFLTEKMVGHVIWETSSEEEREEMCKMELWIMDNFEEWSEMQEVKQLSKAEQKYVMKQKGKKKKAA